MRYCFCQVCRPLRLQRIENDAMTRGELHDRFVNVLPNKIDTDLDKCFADTLELIACGKAYKEACLHGTTYKYFKAWAKRQPQFDENVFPKKEFDAFCHKVNECAWVFENWEKIVANLTDNRMIEVDVRRLSVSQLFKAQRIDWCIQLNDILRRKTKPKGDPMYPLQKFDDIFQNVINSGILQDIDHDPYLAAGIGGRLQHAMVTYCRRRYEPY